MDQGATWNNQITWNISGSPVNLTGYTARMQARENIDSTPLFSWTSTGGQLVLGGAAGTITLNISAATTAGYSDGLYLYDLELESGSGVVTRLLEGNFTINAEVTR